MGHVDGGSLRARNVLQHGRDWIDRVDLSQVSNAERSAGMRDRLITLGALHEETGYSQND